MHVQEKEGSYQDPRQTVEDLRACWPYFRVEDCRADYVRQGNEFAHPYAAEAMSTDGAQLMASQNDLDKPLEQVRSERDELSKMNHERWQQINAEHPEFEEYGWWEEYDVPGCVEEPDAPLVHVLVRRLRPGGDFGDGPFPVVLPISVGGLYANDPYSFTNAPITKYLGCQIITCQPRVYPDAEYPAAINDYHAVYQWMVDNAKELNIDLDRVVIEGASSGGHIAAALPFRLKRYGWCGAPMPRGVVVYEGFFDDRETTRSMRLMTKGWGGLVNRAVNMRYMGRNFASGFIGPEAYANHAYVEECKGLPPYAIYENQDCPACDSALEFVEKLNEAGVYCCYGQGGGCTHTGPVESLNKIGIFYLRDDDYEPSHGMERMDRMEQFFVGNVVDFLTYDLRRGIDESEA